MNPIREAAIAMDQAKVDHPGLAMRMVLYNSDYVTIMAHYKMTDMERRVTWAAIEQGAINILASEIALVVNKLTAQPATANKVTPDFEGKLYAAVLYAITNELANDIDAEDRAKLADAIVAEIRERKLLG